MVICVSTNTYFDHSTQCGPHAHGAQWKTLVNSIFLEGAPQESQTSTRIFNL